MTTTEIAFLFLLIIAISLLIFLIITFRKKLNQNNPEINIDNIKETLIRIENDLKSDFTILTSDQKNNIEKWTKALTLLGINDNSINKLKQQLEQLTKLSDQKQEKNVEKLTETIAKLDENLTNIYQLKNDIKDLNSIFYSTKTRGTLGEFSLYSILSNILGENSKIWEKQCKLIVDSNKSQTGYVDALIHTNDGAENIAIDAKFPLDQYKEIEKNINEKSGATALKITKENFKIAVKDKIKEIKKYLNHKNKITNAILFVPSEAIFTYLISEMNDIFENSFKEKIWICSPTTLAAVLHIIFQAQKDYELNKNIIKVKQLILDISNEYNLFNKRWEALKRKILENQDEIKNLDITITKIQTKQARLNEFDLED